MQVLHWSHVNAHLMKSEPSTVQPDLTLNTCREYGIETDVLLEAALDAWMAQRAADHTQLVELIRAADVRARGLATLDDPQQIVKQVRA